MVAADDAVKQWNVKRGRPKEQKFYAPGNEEGFIRSATKHQERESVQSRALRIKPIERNRGPSCYGY